MARLIPPYGTAPVAIVLTRGEALTALATLNHNATHANREVRRILVEYIARIPEERSE